MTDEHSTDKQIIVDGSMWTLSEESDSAKTFQEIEAALGEGSTVRVAVLDAHRRPVGLLINGATVGTVVLDACTDPRPTETSG